LKYSFPGDLSTAEKVRMDMVWSLSCARLIKIMKIPKWGHKWSNGNGET